MRGIQERPGHAIAGVDGRYCSQEAGAGGQNDEPLPSTQLEIDPQLHHRDGERIFSGYSFSGSHNITPNICAGKYHDPRNTHTDNTEKLKSIMESCPFAIPGEYGID